MASKASQMHFALILVKGADEAWFGQRLPSRNPVHHTRSKMASSSTRNNGSQPAMAEISRERTLPSISGQNKTRGNYDAKTVSIHDSAKNIDRYMLLKNVTENLKNLIFYFFSKRAR